MTVATKTLESKETDSMKETPPEYVSFIYFPGIEIQANNPDYLITGVAPNRRTPFVRHFQFVDGIEHRSIGLHPGTNLGYHFRNPSDNIEQIIFIENETYKNIFSQYLNKQLIDKKIIVPVFPVRKTSNVPQYADFSEDDALMLAGNHTHEKWIDMGLVTETRSVIKTAAEKRKLEILSIRAKLQEGS